MHHLTDTPEQLEDIYAASKEAGYPDRVLMFASTSKVTFAGSGLAAMAASENNLNVFRKQLSIQTIGSDKLNQLRHVRFFKDAAALDEHMKKHAAIIKPKFEQVLKAFDEHLDGKQIAEWSRPAGGYFISLDTLDGCAKAVVRLAAEAGVKLTGAGATFPYGIDPRDRNIRIAPSFPSLSELKTAMDIFCICLEMVSIEKNNG